MSLTLSANRRRMRRRIADLPKVTHDCQTKGVWVRRPKVGLVCVVCNRP